MLLMLRTWQAALSGALVLHHGCELLLPEGAREDGILEDPLRSLGVPMEVHARLRQGLRAIEKALDPGRHILEQDGPRCGSPTERKGDRMDDRVRLPNHAL